MATRKIQAQIEVGRDELVEILSEKTPFFTIQKDSGELVVSSVRIPISQLPEAFVFPIEEATE